MKKILIFGSTGMLGNEVASHFMSLKAFDTYLTYRNEAVSFGAKENKFKFDVLCDDFNILPCDFDYVINCIGIIKPFMGDNLINSIYTNAIFPRKLANWCKDNGMKLIHITTDCVFSGLKGKYFESDAHDALDAYGKSKSLGEPIEDAMVLRTSVIGEEIHKNASLISWAKSQKGNNVKGFTNHFWNGVTTNQYARCCEKIINENLYENGVFHIFAKDIVSKYQMLEYFNEVFELDLTINPFETAPGCDRSLSTIKNLCAKLEISTVKEMVQELKKVELSNISKN